MIVYLGMRSVTHTSLCNKFCVLTYTSYLTKAELFCTPNASNEVESFQLCTRSFATGNSNKRIDLWTGRTKLPKWNAALSNIFYFLSFHHKLFIIRRNSHFCLSERTTAYSDVIRFLFLLQIFILTVYFKDN